MTQYVDITKDLVNIHDPMLKRQHIVKDYCLGL